MYFAFSLKQNTFKMYYYLLHRKKVAWWVGFKKILRNRGGSCKILRLLTRWVGGSKKGQNYAYVIYEWSLIGDTFSYTCRNWKFGSGTGRGRRRTTDAVRTDRHEG